MRATSRWPGIFGRRDHTEPTFLLGAGAHLAGVRALHRYLAASPQCQPGVHREYHVLDSAGLPSEGRVRDLLLDRAQHSLDLARTQGQADGTALHRAAMIADPDVYFDHFTGLLARPDTRLTMDLTPEHSLLSAGQLSAVREGFTTRGVRTVSVFAMRDPLDRVVTHVRLQQKQRPDLFPGPLEGWVERLYAEPGHEARTRYDRTLQALDAAFEPGNLWFGFYERLLSAESLSAISDVCRIDYRDDDRAPVRPRSRVDAGLPTSLARTVVRHYQDVYEHVADRFGMDDLSAVWPSSELLG